MLWYRKGRKELFTTGKIDFDKIHNFEIISIIIFFVFLILDYINVYKTNSEAMAKIISYSKNIERIWYRTKAVGKSCKLRMIHIVICI